MYLFFERCEIDPASFVLQVRAQKDIKKNEEITTRYFGPWEGQPNRQLRIQRNWRFICNCHRCQDPSDLSTYFSAIKCKDCSDVQSNGDVRMLTQTGYLLPVDLQKLGASWKCNNCNKMKPVKEIDHVLQTMDKLIDLIKSDILCSINSDLTSITQIVESFITKIEEIVHPNHFMVFQFKKWISKLPLSPQANSSDKIDFMELQMKYHSEMMKIIETLDPGLTLNRASHHKQMAQCRIQLSKQKMVQKSEGYSKMQHLDQMKMAMCELKEVSASFKYPEKISLEDVKNEDVSEDTKELIFSLFFNR